MSKILFPSARLGVMGSGQLGRMFAQEAIRMGYRVSVYSPERNTPAALAGAEEVVVPYEDETSLRKFLASVDAVTFEFENIPNTELTFIENFSKETGLVVSPRPACIRIAQHRIREKTIFRNLGLPTVDFYPITNKSDAVEAVEKCKFPAVLKTSTFGYDGKGQTKYNSKEEFRFWAGSLGSEPLDLILEEWAFFDKEASVILARSRDGKSFCFSPSENVHKNHILDLTIHPGKFPEKTKNAMVAAAVRLAEGIDYVGVFGLEFFIVGETFLLNEFAPRPHNSGHFSQDAASVSQFELQVRTLVGLPIPDFILSSDSSMKNILGQDFVPDSEQWLKYMSDARYSLHLYGKSDPRRDRKMGHWNYVGENPEKAFL
ncbi:phosphoribosylaminoimidazole carboxylase, ATPase subunit [Leptospira broomii serovar Hurstbridge str. 5399]|uniref:N5-carboxyaminoimidazole ribonucleotide synthase n=1 Tax=Leptospira broomii serovar Hurstbridge str. 5399 TaxID=1049789 RepID=T0FAU2_9LEPT|nr:5-(carboxyamino)imidazole ribonucleotide synthase [Leptospira broomii]EQA44667.1 phosphoribosylaminoimidazole carboxylase, ATPase subunit [Leptospira broomii serovar Hurstbridge str. 5399]